MVTNICEHRNNLPFVHRFLMHIRAEKRRNTALRPSCGPMWLIRLLHIFCKVIYRYPMHSHRIGSVLLLALTTFVSAQSSLKLIPIPREVRAGADKPLPRGVRVVCGAPCATEDQFA